MGESVEELLAPGAGVIRPGRDLVRRNRAAYLARRGRLSMVLPDVFIASGATDHLPTLARAACVFDVNAVITGRAAAALTYWPQAPGLGVEVAVRGDVADRPPFKFVERRIPAELIIERQGIRLTTPALTALDLCIGPAGIDAIDRALQLRQCTVGELYDALTLTPNRRGNAVRRRLIDEVRSGACSVLERTGHRLLHEAGLDEDLLANSPITVGGVRMVPDLRSRHRRVAIEFDGFSYHSDRTAFDLDRVKGNALALARYVLLRITQTQLQEPATFLRQVRKALRIAPPY